MVRRILEPIPSSRTGPYPVTTRGVPSLYRYRQVVG
jgi:hypothetical protein